jgi:serine/threonine-protein kinase
MSEEQKPNLSPLPRKKRKKPKPATSQTQMLKPIALVNPDELLGDGLAPLPQNATPPPPSSTRDFFAQTTSEELDSLFDDVLPGGSSPSSPPASSELLDVPAPPESLQSDAASAPTKKESPLYGLFDELPVSTQPSPAASIVSQPLSPFQTVGFGEIPELSTAPTADVNTSPGLRGVPDDAYDTQVALHAVPTPPNETPRSSATPRPSATLPRLTLQHGKLTQSALPSTRFETIKTIASNDETEHILVRDTMLQRVVVHKRLQDNHTQHTLLRFLRELECVSQLHHPGIPPIHDAGIDREGRYFFSEPYISGDSLQTIIQKLRDKEPSTTNAFPLSKRLNCFTRILHILQFAHQQGIIHRDLKPEHIYFGPHDEITISGWACAKQLRNHPQHSLVATVPESIFQIDEQELSPTTSPQESCYQKRYKGHWLVGTPAYMSPEQAIGQPATEQSDLYSLATILYEWLTLQHPLASHANQLQTTLAALSKHTPLLAHNANPEHNIPKALSALLHDCLQKEPANRPGTIAAFRKSLEQLQDQHGSSPLHTGSSRTRLILSVVSIPLLALAGFGAYQLLQMLLGH